MNEVEYCVKNMRTKSVIDIFDSKQEAVNEAKRLNTEHQTNEYWPINWKTTVQHD
jgi:hypothetical protein